MSRADNIAPAPFALHRNPNCIAPRGAARSSHGDAIEHQAARILELDGQLASVRGKLHDANNRIQAAEGALEMIGSLLGLDATASPAEVVAEAIARFK